MNLIFYVVAQSLNWIASLTGFTYNEINIIAYYILLPFIYVVLLDRIMRTHVLKVLYVLAWASVLYLTGNFSEFSDSLFESSANFLLLFSAVGLDYVAASVVICVILPALVFVVLLLAAVPSVRRRLFLRRDEHSVA